MPFLAEAEPPISPASLFGLGGGRIHLCAGQEGPIPRSTLALVREQAEYQTAGMEGRRRHEAMLDDLRGRLASFVGDPAHPERIGFTASVGHGLDILSRLVRWEHGDTILTFADEFPSVILSWAPLGERGVGVKAIPAADAPEDSMLEAITDETRIVCVSHVSFRTGRRLDLERISAGLRGKNVLLIVDASHSLGVLPVPIDACDAMVACGHKFLLGVHGTGIVYLRNKDLLETRAYAPLGWYAVDDWSLADGGPHWTRKPGALGLEVGSPAFLPLGFLREGLSLLENAGPTRVSQHALALAQSLRQALETHGIPCMTPASPESHGTSISIPDPCGERVHKELARRNIIATHRSGRLRISFHGYNRTDELDAVVDVLKGFPEHRGAA